MADMDDFDDLDDAPEEPIDDVPYSQVQAWLVVPAGGPANLGLARKGLP